MGLLRLKKRPRRVWQISPLNLKTNYMESLLIATMLTMFVKEKGLLSFFFKKEVDKFSRVCYNKFIKRKEI